MSMPTTASATTPSIPKVHVLKPVNIFWGAFVVTLVFNLLLIVTVYTFGVSTGFEGQPSFNWEQFGTSVNFLFGGFGSLLSLIGGLVLVAGTLWFVHWLSVNGHHKWVVVTFAAGLIVGGYIVWQLVDWANFGFGFVPFLGFLVFTAVEALVVMMVIPALHLSRKRGTNH